MILSLECTCSDSKMSRLVMILLSSILYIARLNRPSLKMGFVFCRGTNRPLAHTARAQDTRVWVKKATGLNQSTWSLPA